MAIFIKSFSVLFNLLFPKMNKQQQKFKIIFKSPDENALGFFKVKM